MVEQWEVQTKNDFQEKLNRATEQGQLQFAKLYQSMWAPKENGDKDGTKAKS